MPEAIPELVDLVLFSKKVRKEPGGAALSEAVTEACDAHTVLRSLKSAESLLTSTGMIDEHFKKMDLAMVLAGQDLAAVGQAIVGQALLVYCRVTHGSGPLRKLSLKGLNDEHKLVHSEVLTVRNEVFAHHVHKTKHPQGPWERQYAVFNTTTPVEALRFPFLSANWRGAFLNRFHQLIIATIPLARAEYREKSQTLLTTLTSFMTQNPGHRATFFGCELDRTGFSEGVVASILSRDGDEFGRIDHMRFDAGGAIVPEPQGD